MELSAIGPFIMIICKRVKLEVGQSNGSKYTNLLININIINYIYIWYIEIGLYYNTIIPWTLIILTY